MASPGSSRKRCIITVCLTVTAVIILVVLLLVILGFTVFKPKKPVTTVNSVSIADLDFDLGVSNSSFSVRFNVSLDAGVTVRNPNRVGFKYSNGIAYLRYRGKDVGEVPIPAGKVGARSDAGMNLTLTVMADRLVFDSDFYNDAVSGTLPFQAFVRLKGKVRILFNFHVTAYATCDLQIHPFRRTVDQECHYRTKL